MSKEKRFKKLVENCLGIVKHFDDPKRDGLKETPQRMAKALSEIFSGYGKDPSEHFKMFPITNSSSESHVCVRVPIYSMCEHHMLPIIGEATIRCSWENKVLGLSKYARIVEIYCSRLQTQEQLAIDICNAFMLIPECLNITIEMNCRHMCMEMRGVKVSNSSTTTIHSRDRDY